MQIIYKKILFALIIFFGCAATVSAQNWTTAAQLAEARMAHNVVELNDGRILIIGGGPTLQTSLASVEIFDYRDNSVAAAADMVQARMLACAELLDDGRVFVAGGATAMGSAINFCEIYDPATDSWTAAASMSVRRERFAMVSLPDGRLLATGGIGGAPNTSENLSLATCEIYDPATDTWTPSASLPSIRNSHSAILLNNGLVLCTRGYSHTGGYYVDCELYDPLTDVWTPTASFLERGTGEHRMTMMADGRILRTGGWAGPQQWSEIYDPATGEWTATAPMNHRRSVHSQVLLENDRTLVIAGMDAIEGAESKQHSVSSVEEFDPQTNVWTEVEPLPVDVVWSMAHRLRDGQVAVFGGSRWENNQSAGASNQIFISNYAFDDNSARVAGNVWYDFDGDGEQGLGDVGASGAQIEITPGPYYVTCDNNGDYEAFLPVGQYEVCIDKDMKHWDVSWTASGEDCYALDVQDIGDEFSGIDFGIEPKRLVEELDISIVGSRPRPGFPVYYYLTYRNNGTIPYTGNLAFMYDQILDFVKTSPLQTTYEGVTLTWFLENLPVGATGTIMIMLQVPADISLLGTDVCVNAEYQRKNNDDLLRNGKDRFCSEVRGAYDPNEMIVTPRGQGERGLIVYDRTQLSYTIYFQNLGTDTAFTVRIENQLTDDLDYSSFQLGQSSHPVTVSITPDGLATFLFRDIELPHKAENEAGSQGYVRYYINPHDPGGRTVEIKNGAGIYFDFNPPVITNRVLNTLEGGVTSVDDEPVTAPTLLVQPNPVNESFVVSGLTSMPARLELSDELGRVQAVDWTVGVNSLSVDSSKLAAGVYWLRLSFGNGEVLTLPLSVQR